MLPKKYSIPGLPEDVDLHHADFQSLREAIDRGGFSILAEELAKPGGRGRRFSLCIMPSDMPKHWVQSPKKDWYDPSIYDVNEYGRITAKDREILNRPEGIYSGFLFRGMSYEEFTESRLRGYIESRGGYNLDGQEGLTYFSRDAGQAAHYASGFAPWQFKPTPARPAVLVQIKDPGHHIVIPGTGEFEVGLRGRIPFDMVVDSHFAHPIGLTPGEMEINEDWYQNRFVPGSGSGLNIFTSWSKHESGLQINISQKLKANRAQDFIDTYTLSDRSKKLCT